MDLAFFGLTSTNFIIHRKNVFTQIHEIVFHGKGGYDWYSVYNMPIWLRNFTFNKINEFYTKKKEMEESSQEKSNSKNLIDSSGRISNPTFSNKTSYK